MRDPWTARRSNQSILKEISQSLMFTGRTDAETETSILWQPDVNDTAIPLLGIYSEKTIIQKDTCTPMFTAALSTVARTWMQPR